MLREIRRSHIMNATHGKSSPFSGPVSPSSKQRSLSAEIIQDSLSMPVAHSLQISVKHTWISVYLSYLPIYIWKPVSSSVRIACITHPGSISVYLDVL